MQLATATTTTTTPKNTNAPTFADLMATAKQLGEQCGKGKDTQIQFDLAVIEGAYLGALSLDADKHGKGRNDATVLAEQYVRATQGAVIFDAKADKSRKQVSNVQKCIKVGANPKWGRGQPMQFVQEFIEFRQKVRSKDPSALKKAPNGKTEKDLDDAHNGLMRLLTRQQKEDRLLSDDERNSYAFKTDKSEKSETEQLEAARKSLRKSNDQSVQIKNAIDSITLRLANIAKGIK
jgi:hypothetical protein